MRFTCLTALPAATKTYPVRVMCGEIADILHIIRLCWQALEGRNA
jgi:hypothetical protein